MTDVPTSEYLTDQGKRMRLLDSLVSALNLVQHLSETLLDIEDGGISNYLVEQATTDAMDLFADLQIIRPMLVDILTMDDA